ncbi:hypothetical protein BG005_011895 [Podila minutissima]|nr:hypothetical protein BG005_011895 [Podila minutissima]
MDTALTFGLNGAARNVALWTHRSILEQQPGLAKLISKLRAVEGPVAGSSVIAGVQSYHVTEFSLESYCSLIRYLYMGTIELKIDLDDFAIAAAAVLKVRHTTFGELFQLADCYQVRDLRGYCRARIIESMDESNAMSILFGFAYRFEDLKSVVLKFVVDHLDKMYAGEKDPFEEYKDHTERSALLADMLKLKFKASA